MNKEYFVAPIQTADDVRQCAQLMAEEFVQNNPLIIYLQGKAESLFEHWFHPAILKVLDQKLCFLVRHRPTNEVVAATIAQDFFIYCQEHPYDPSASASTNYVSDLFYEMIDQFVRQEFQQPLKPNQVLYISAGATRSSHAGQGVAGYLRAHLCRYARDQRGYEYGFIQTMHPATRHIYLKKLKGRETSVVHPETWQWKKMGDGTSCPMKDYQGEPIVNVLVPLADLE